MSLAEDRENFFELAKESGMAEDLSKFAKVFGRFQAASIELKDGRSAAYTIPQNIKLKPLNTPDSQPLSSVPIGAEHPSVVKQTSQYARFRNK